MATPSRRRGSDISSRWPGNRPVDAPRSRYMRSAPVRRTLLVATAALMAAFLLPSAHAGAGGPAGHPLRARITGAVIAGPSTAAAAAPDAASGLPSKQDQIKVLRAALAKMKRNFTQFAGV